MASATLIVNVDVGPTLAMALALVRTAERIIDAIPDYVLERGTLLCELEEFKTHITENLITAWPGKKES